MLPAAGLVVLALLFGTFAFWKRRAQKVDVAGDRSAG
jgi:hypothetical protein